MAEPPTLTNMPPEVLTRVMDELDIRKILSLRKVCKTLRDFIDFQNARPQLLDLNIYVAPNNIEAWYYTGKGLNVVNYKKYEENGCKTVHDSQEKLLENLDYLDVFLTDFEFFLIHQNSTLRLFRVVRQANSNRDHEIFTKIFEKVESCLKPRPFKLKSEEFHLAVKKEVEIISILSLMDAEVLKNISIYSNCGDLVHLETGELIKMEQWKRAKELLIENMIVNIPMKELVHFSFVTVALRKVDVEDLEMLKENFLQTSAPKEFQFSYTHFTDEPPFFQSLADPIISSDIFGRTEKMWTIPVQGQDKNLEITHFVQRNTFKFTNIKPLGGGIKFF